jgi:UDP-glucose 4-epimerase
VNDDLYRDKVVAITGGTGSFGSTMLRRLLPTQCAEIRVFSRDESKQDSMRHEIVDGRIRYFIGDVRDAGRVRELARGVDYLFHAAALKQVPSCELFPDEAYRTNVIGSENVLRAAVEMGIPKVVCLSTDKAVQPVNAMGMSKALMEKLVGAQAQKLGNAAHTVICCVRYGNVLSSRGSVIPLFIEKARRGETLPITVPEMTRFLLSLQEAIEMVDFAIEHGEQGELIIRMSSAATVEDIAGAVSRLLQVSLKTDVIGRRPGEKIHETLATLDELSRASVHGNFIRSKPDRKINRVSLPTPWGKSITDEFTSENTLRMDCDSLYQRLSEVREIRLQIDRR